jgi:hypothetical protein
MSNISKEMEEAIRRGMEKHTIEHNLILEKTKTFFNRDTLVSLLTPIQYDNLTKFEDKVNSFILTIDGVDTSVRWFIGNDNPDGSNGKYVVHTVYNDEYRLDYVNSVDPMDVKFSLPILDNGKKVSMSFNELYQMNNGVNDKRNDIIDDIFEDILFDEKVKRLLSLLEED